MRTRILLAMVAALGLVTFTQTASAANYCVGSSAACTGSPVADFSFDEQGILDAVAASNANSGADTVHIAAGTITLESQLFISGAPGEELRLLGAGAASTLFTSSIPNSSQINLSFSTATSSAGGLGLTVADSPADAFGITLVTGKLHSFELRETGSSASNFRGTYLASGAKLEQGLISLTSPNSTGVVAQSGSASVRDVDVRGAGTGRGVNASTAGTLDFSKIRLSGFNPAIYIDSGELNLTDSLIEMGSIDSAKGISAYNMNHGSSPINVTAKRTTIVGHGGWQSGLFLGADSPNETLYARFHDLLIYTTGNGAEAGRCYGGAPAGSIDVEFVNWAANAAVLPLDGCSFDPGNRTDLALANPGFRNYAGGDYRLTWNSPLVDKGESEGALPSDLVDVAGDPRPVDGDGDGSRESDIGAFEYQRSAPVVSIEVSRSVLDPLEAADFSVTASDPDGEAVSYAWSVDGAVVSQTGSLLSIGFVTAGGHTVTATVTDEAGFATSITAQVSVRQPACTPPAQIKLSGKPKGSFKYTGKGFKLAADRAKQPFLSLIAPAGNVKVTLQSVGSKKKLKSLKGSQSLTLKAGTSKFTFGGRWNKKRLKAGRYKATISATGTSDCPPPPATTVGFSLR